MVLGFVPGLLDPFTPFKAAVLRVAGLGMLAYTVLSWTSLALSRSPADRNRSGFTPAPLTILDLAVIAWAAVALLSCATSVSVPLSLFGEIEQREGLLTTLALVGLYAGVRRSHRAIADARGTLDTVVACAAVAAGYGLLQRAGLDPLQWAATTSYPAGEARVMSALSRNTWPRVGGRRPASASPIPFAERTRYSS